MDAPHRACERGSPSRRLPEPRLEAVRSSGRGADRGPAAQPELEAAPVQAAVRDGLRTGCRRRAAHRRFVAAQPGDPRLERLEAPARRATCSRRRPRPSSVDLAGLRLARVDARLERLEARPPERCTGTGRQLGQAVDASAEHAPPVRACSTAGDTGKRAGSGFVPSPITPSILPPVRRARAMAAEPRAVHVGDERPEDAAAPAGTLTRRHLDGTNPLGEL
jgi:hypothetical protein